MINFKQNIHFKVTRYVASYSLRMMNLSVQTPVLENFISGCIYPVLTPDHRRRDFRNVRNKCLPKIMNVSWENRSAKTYGAKRGEKDASA